MAKYDKIAVLFKERNKNIFDWIVRKSEKEDISMTKFILQCLKKIKAQEDKDASETNS